MPKTAPIPRCSEDDRKTLGNWAASRTLEVRLVERARIILQCLCKAERWPPSRGT